MPHVHFVTGRLAEHSLREVAAKVAEQEGFAWSVSVMPITVAALMTPEWIAKRLVGQIPVEATRVILPGYCRGDLQPVQDVAGARPVERGPKDLRELPQFFGQQPPRDYGAYDIEIIAEINHAPGLSLDFILHVAARLKADGADLIDIGCNPGEPWAGVGQCVRALRGEGFRVSIDSFDTWEVEQAVEAGAELVLSVNKSNREAARDWGCEVVVLPDEPGTLNGLEETIDFLAAGGVRLRVDPILSPIGFGFAESLGRYLEARRRWPEAEMMMGIGNLTELTDADSAAINVILLGFCQELGIRSVLTTQVINWARTCVKECDLARRLVYHAVKNHTLPKHVEPNLLLLRDERLTPQRDEALARLSEQIKDNNYRIFAEGSKLHLISAGLHLSGDDPFDILHALLVSGPGGVPPKNLDAAHAFYLGYELSKAVTALALSKQYRQDEALDWGFLTRPEVSHRT